MTLEQQIFHEVAILPTHEKYPAPEPPEFLMVVHHPNLGTSRKVRSWSGLKRVLGNYRQRCKDGGFPQELIKMAKLMSVSYEVSGKVHTCAQTVPLAVEDLRMFKRYLISVNARM